MKGVVLAGGLGSRLSPLTKITNKHLLPVWNKPMVYYPIEYLVKSGIEEVLLVTGGSHAGDFLNLLKNGKQFGLKKLEYAYQEGEGGIADALKLARTFAGNEPICVVLGDNIYEYAMPDDVTAFQMSSNLAAIVTVPVSRNDALKATRFGVAFCCEAAQYVKPEAIREKPEEYEILDWLDGHDQQFCRIITGTYFYRPEVFDICESLSPSARNELEISDVNRAFLQANELGVYRTNGWWLDAGTFESLAEATAKVRNAGANKCK